MSERPEPDAPPLTPEEAAATGTLAARFSLRQRSGGIVVPDRKRTTSGVSVPRVRRMYTGTSP